jgi:hypothetical protein
LTETEARAETAHPSMGQADQIAKEVMASETTASSGSCVVFEVPVEVPVGFLAPDGVMRVLDAPGLAHLPLPWRRLRLDATTEIKMPGDHTDRPALARAELRRQARFTRQLEQARDAPEKPPATHDARDYACWIVSAALPRWVTEDAAAGLLSLHSLGAGIWQLGPRPFDLLWIAANALPLEIELLPFLVARSGVALAEFLDWAVEAKGPAWVYHVVQHLPMDQESTEKYAALYRDEEAQRRLKTEMTRKLLRLLPEAGDEVRAEAEREGMREGKREGERMGVRHAIFALLSARGITLTEAQRAQIEAATEMPQLDAWLMAAVTATSADKVLAVTPPTTTDPH